MDPGLHLTDSDSPSTPEEVDEMSKKPYCTLVGSLMYLTGCTRPDLSYPVGVLCRYMSKPGMAHWKAAKRVLKYLKGTDKEGLTYGGS